MSEEQNDQNNELLRLEEELRAEQASPAPLEEAPIPAADEPTTWPVEDTREEPVGSEPAQDEQVEGAPKPAREPSKNTVQDFETYEPLKGSWDENAEHLVLPAGSNEEINKALAHAPNVRLDDSEQSAGWADTVSAGARHSVFGGSFMETVKRPEGIFRQGVKSERGLLGPGAPRFNDKPDQLLTGERAILRMRSVLGMGSIVQIPFWHSGFWVTFKCPSDGQLLELQRRLLQEKINLGRAIQGLVFSNRAVYTSGWLIDFALANIYDTTLELTEGDDIRKLIKVQDIPLLVYGLACAIYPDGFPYAKSCVREPEKCNYVFREKLNLGKLLWVDNRELSKWQIAHMANRGGKVAVSTLERYQEEFSVGKPRDVELTDKVKMTLKSPTVADYLTVGYRWVNNIVSMVDQSFGLAPDNDDRNKYIEEQSKATNMRQFSHWIKSIDVGLSHPIEDESTLEQAIDTLSGIDSVAEAYFTEIGKFIDDSTIAVIAVPTMACPKCETPIESNLPRFPHLLPLDVMSTFFTLLGQRAWKIRNR